MGRSDSTIISTYVTQELRNRIEAAAAARGVALSRHMRDICTQSLEGEALPAVGAARIERTLGGHTHAAACADRLCAWLSERIVRTDEVPDGGWCTAGDVLRTWICPAWRRYEPWVPRAFKDHKRPPLLGSSGDFSKEMYAEIYIHAVGIKAPRPSSCYERNTPMEGMAFGEDCPPTDEELLWMDIGGRR